ncbi:MAG: hypothetical protein ACU0FH_20280 [Heliomarina sp.]|uniref:hypothetical protein n=1 Tax=Heliomarina sp. TaxID=2917556 RepID=UPI004058B7D2
MLNRNAPKAALMVTFAAALGAPALAETDYRDFYGMTEDQQGEIITDEAARLIEEAEAAGELFRRDCTTALFYSSIYNPIQGRLPTGWKTLFDVIEYERRSMDTYEHGQSVEDAIRDIAALYCPPEPR